MASSEVEEERRGVHVFFTFYRTLQRRHARFFRNDQIPSASAGAVVVYNNNIILFYIMYVNIETGVHIYIYILLLYIILCVPAQGYPTSVVFYRYIRRRGGDCATDTRGKLILYTPVGCDGKGEGRDRRPQSYIIFFTYYYSCLTTLIIYTTLCVPRDRKDFGEKNDFVRFIRTYYSIYINQNIMWVHYNIIICIYIYII